MSNIIELATRLSMGLTHLLFPENPTLSDVRLLANARMHLWSDWEDLDFSRRAQIAEYLAFRPNELSDYNYLLKKMSEILQAGDDFDHADPDEKSEPGWNTRYSLVAGAPLEDRIKDWLEELKQKKSIKSIDSVIVTKAQNIVIHAGGQNYKIPTNHVPPDLFLSLKLSTATPQSYITLNRDELSKLAKKVDGPDGTLYHKHAIEGFLDRFMSKERVSPVQKIDAGITKLGVAPTGTGKSIFVGLLALYLSMQGTVSAIVVPDIHAVWKEVLRLRRAIKNTGLNLRVVPISSWRSIAPHLKAHIKQPPAEDQDGQWALENVSYVCHLLAYAEDTEKLPEMGKEPCNSLNQVQENRKKANRVQCPFITQCKRFSAFEAAMTADILVINHHAFLSGQVPVPVSIDNASPQKISTAEMAIRLCSAIFIDEIDAFQSAAINADSRKLTLSPQGSPTSKPSQLYRDVEHRNDPKIPFYDGRSAFLNLMGHAGNLTEAVNRGELEWPFQGRMTWNSAYDASIANALFREQENGLKMVKDIFNTAKALENPLQKKVRHAINSISNGWDNYQPLLNIKRIIMESINDMEFGEKKNHKQQRLRKKIADWIAIRTMLTRIDRALTTIHQLLPALEQEDFALAGEIRDSLLGYVPWQPSPVGALGKRMYGYVFSHRDNNERTLDTQGITGDPHGLIRELGNIVAMSLSGSPRVVVGFSATCRFPGSPKADICGEMAGWVPDEAENVRVQGAGVETRISGIKNRNKRLEAAQSVARELWESTLSSYLDGLIKNEKTSYRARAMLVTGSYDEAEAVYKGLKKAAGNFLNVRYLIRDSQHENNDYNALHRKKVEIFGQTPAPAVLVGPLSVVARGHNILVPDSDKSALSGIFVLTRPVPPSHDAGRLLAHIAYNAHISPPVWTGSPGDAVKNEIKEAWSRLNKLLRSQAAFRYMDSDLRRELVCDVLVDLAQLAGRARRGGTPVDLVFVDGAFQDEIAPWKDLVNEVFDGWEKNGWLSEMFEIHGAFIKGLADYAGFRPPEK